MNIFPNLRSKFANIKDQSNSCQTWGHPSQEVKYPIWEAVGPSEQQARPRTFYVSLPQTEIEHRSFPKEISRTTTSRPSFTKSTPTRSKTDLEVWQAEKFY
ncbi:hypothetical protein NPIL_127311 [Nephila pilipes]|uniref:Uncharacterized protein n=1 Tax=Nephila pilipes TaxID=299642 RepID=A0A8X6IRM8_NEPPI|nr:hypothetical protein NPIL_127311 [Nephila pilipes]